MYDFAAITQDGSDAFSVLLHGLRLEFQCHDVEVLAAQFLDAEAEDFRWESRIAERGLGPCDEQIEADVELDRVAILGCLAGNWYAGTACVDGDGRLWSMHGCQHFDRRREAEEAFRMLD